MSKNADLDEYEYSKYSVGFDAHRSFSLLVASELCKNVTIFDANMSSSVHIDNNKKDILIFGKDPTDGLNDTTLTTEKEYSINFTKQQIQFCLRLHYIIMGWLIILLLTATGLEPRTT